MHVVITASFITDMLTKRHDVVAASKKEAENRQRRERGVGEKEAPPNKPAYYY
jgi:hypothetical protein